MKRIYSVILLFTFLIGALQPIMPMIEFQLFKGSVVELLAHDFCHSIESCKMTYCLVNADCSSDQDDNNQQLLDTDFYPLALQITTIPSPEAFLIGQTIDLPIIGEVVSPTILPNPPPLG